MRSLCLVVLAKAPVAGYVKTRLIPALGLQGAADLARDMLYHTLDQALKADIGTVELCASPARRNPAWRAVTVPRSIAWSNQGKGNLGERMARVAKRKIAAGQSILLIGTDCPELDATYLRSAAIALQQYDAVMAPSFDGGYALLGLNRFHSSIFADIRWSTSAVASTTQQRFSQLAWRTHCLPTVRDIDDPEDLQWLETLSLYDSASFPRAARR